MFRSLIAALLIVPLLALSTVTPCRADTGLHGSCGMPDMQQQQQPAEKTGVPPAVKHRCCDETPTSTTAGHSIAKPCCCMMYLTGEDSATPVAPSHYELATFSYDADALRGHSHRVDRPPQI